MIRVVEPLPAQGVVRMTLSYGKCYNGHYVGVVSGTQAVHGEAFSSATDICIYIYISICQFLICRFEGT